VKVKKNWVPSAFTMTNLFCGYLSVILCTSGRFIQAAWLIVAAAVLDALDGKIARFAKVNSRFGVEYDSLADVISFGFAPSMLLYKAVFVNWGILGLFISVAPLVFGSIRLARFNIRLKDFTKEYFEGLPIPAAAVTIATFLVFNFHFWGFFRWEKVCLFLVIALSVLMVTSIRYETFPNFSLQSGLQNRYKFLVVIVGILLVIIFPQEAFFPLATTYVLSGPVYLTWQILQGGNGRKSKKNEG
jgi:CDP-diacylglycerol--serine O-phosphatidyltransferase